MSEDMPGALYTRPVLCAMNNPLSRDPRYALFPAPVNCTGYRVWQMLATAALMGEPPTTIRRQDYVEAFDRRNVLSALNWSRREAMVGGLALMDELSGRTIVVFGVQTAEALRLPRLPWGQWGEHYHLLEPTRYCVLPHPSGRCREYNDPEMRVLAGGILLQLYRGEKPWET